MLDLGPIQPKDFDTTDLAERIELVHAKNVYWEAFNKEREGLKSASAQTPSLDQQYRETRDAQMTGPHSRRIE